MNSSDLIIKSNMENIEEYIRKSKLAKRVQEIWNVANNIIGYSLIATVIILGVKNGYCGSNHFTVFCWAAGIYFCPALSAANSGSSE